jgi:hypothetical protein
LLAAGDLRPNDLVDVYEDLVWDVQVREVPLSVLRTNGPRPMAIHNLFRTLGWRT